MVRRLTLGSIFLSLVVAVAARAAAPGDPIRTDAYTETIRVACIGDSITFGHGVHDRRTNCYPAVLGRLLGEKFHVRNFGVSAATLLKKGDKPYWKLRAFKLATDFAPHALVIKLGTNDSKPQNWRHKAEFAADLRAMIDHFAKLPSHPRIWLCLPVPVYRTRWGINEETVKGKIIPIIKQVAAEASLPTIDLHAALSGHPELFPDNIHPNAAGAALMAQAVHAALTGIVSRNAKHPNRKAQPPKGAEVK